MFAIEDKASKACAREIRGTMSIASAFTFLARKASTKASFWRGHRKLTMVCPSLSSGSSPSDGALTL